MLTGKKTKIVATIGPVTETEEQITRLVKAGMNVIRLNFSHGDHLVQKNRINLARIVSKNLNTPLAVLQDLSGPKIRTGDLEEESALLQEGCEIILTTENVKGDESKISINYPKLPKEVKVNDIMFLNDGKQKLQVVKIKGVEVTCKILIGGEIKSRRGVNFPDSKISISSLTAKDKEDVKFGIENDVDFIALSFVRRPEDVLELKAILEKAKADIRVIAKIETKEAIENIDEIIKVTDGIMVARGDLGIEVAPEQVPIYQKEIIKKCNAVGKPVITATQMLSSMTSSPTPTRAEINDIANAILDGTDAVMLSEETTIGKHPEEAVKVMTRVALHTEKAFEYEEILKRNHLNFKDVTDSVSYAAVNIAHELNAKAIIALSVSGFTARKISRYKPNRPILVITPNKKTYNRLALSFNCYPALTEMFTGITHSIETSKKVALETSFAKKDDLVLIVAGLPLEKAGNTNTLLVQKI